MSGGPSTSGEPSGAPDVFISYSRRNSDQVAELVERLQERGVAVWLDQSGIDAATRWSEEIVNAITGCKVFLFVASATSFESENVATELSIAKEEHKPILPIYLEPVKVPASIRYQLAGIQHQELFGPGAEKAFEAILRSLNKLGVQTGGEPSATAQPARRKLEPLRLALLAGLLVALALGLRSNLPDRTSPSAVASVALLALALPPLLRWTWRAARRRAREDFRATVAGAFGTLLAWPFLSLLVVGTLASFTDDLLPGVEAAERPGLLVRVPPGPTMTSGLVLRVYRAAPPDDAAAEQLLGEQETQGKHWVYFPSPGHEPADLDAELQQQIEAWGDAGTDYQWGPTLDLDPDDTLKVQQVIQTPDGTELPLPNPESFSVRTAPRATGSRTFIRAVLK